MRAFLVATLLLLMSVQASGAPVEAQRALERGLSLESRGRLAEARDAFSEAIRLDPELFEAWRKRGWAKNNLGDHKGAITDFERAIEIQPRNAAAWNGRGAARHKGGDIEGALQDFQKAIDLDPKYASPWVNRAMLKREQKDAEGALEDASRAVVINPSDSSAIYERGQDHYALKDYKGAIEDFSKAIALNEKKASFWDARGLAKRQDGDFRGALADIERAIALDPKDARFLVDRGTVKSKQRDVAGARADYKGALQLDPSNALAQKALSALDSVSGVPERGTVLEDGEGLEKAIEGEKSGALGKTAKKGPTSKGPGGARTPSATQSRQTDLPSVQFKADDPCSPKHPTAGTPWQKASTVPVALPLVEGVALPAPLDVGALSRVQYAGAVSTAHEEMRLLYGPMSDENTRRFESIWAPLFDSPSREVVDYLNRLNPLLAQFLAGREAMMRAAAGYEGALLDASLAVAAKERAGWDDAMTNATRQAKVMQSLEAGMRDLGRRIEALGNPPNPLEAKCNARRRHEKAVAAVREALPAAVEAPPVGGVFGANRAFLDSGAKFLDRVARGNGGSDGTGIRAPATREEMSWTGRSFEARWLDPPREMRIRGTLSADGRLMERLEFTAEGVQIVAVNMPYRPQSNPKEFHYVASGSKNLTINGTPTGWVGVGSAGQAGIDVSLRVVDGRPVVRRTPGPASGPGAQTAPADVAKADAAAKAAAAEELRETIETHQANVSYLERALQKAQDELGKETESKRLGALSLEMVQLQSDIQAEKDLIASYQTGQIVHNRSAFDDFAQQKFIQGMQEEASRVDATRRIAAAIERQIEILPEDQRASMREKAASILDAKSIASGDLEKARRLAGAMDNQVQGYWQGQSARAEEKALAAQEHEFYTTMVIQAVGGAVVGVGSAAFAETFGEAAAVTVWAPHLIGGVYGGVTGTIAGGPVEGVREAVSAASKLGDFAVKFVGGYQDAQSNPKAGLGDKLWNGATQAGTSFLFNKAFEIGGTMVAKGAVTCFGKDSTLFKPVVGWKRTAAQEFDAARTAQQVADGKSLIGVYQQKEFELARLRANSPAGSPELRKLEGELQNLAASLNSSYHCKWLLKYEAHPLVRSKFNARVERSYREMTPEMTANLKAMGYDTHGVEFASIRNASSAGSSSMDLDLALKEHPGMVFTKGGREVSLGEFMKDAQDAMSRAYHKVTGFSATRSELNLTTSLHPEAFTDVRLLKKNVDFSTIGAQDIANIGNVIKAKMSKIKNDPILTKIGKTQASCRESLKEIDNMLLPNLRQKLVKAKSPAETSELKAEIEHWEGIQRTFKQIGTAETDPHEIIKLQRSLREQTGGSDVYEVIGDLRRAFTKLGGSR